MWRLQNPVVFTWEPQMPHFQEILPWVKLGPPQHRLLVRDEDGNVVAEGDPNNYYVMDNSEDDLETYRQTAYLPVPNLRPGNVVEARANRPFA